MRLLLPMLVVALAACCVADQTETPLDAAMELGDRRGGYRKPNGYGTGGGSNSFASSSSSSSSTDQHRPGHGASGGGSYQGGVGFPGSGSGGGGSHPGGSSNTGSEGGAGHYHGGSSSSSGSHGSSSGHGSGNHVGGSHGSGNHGSGNHGSGNHGSDNHGSGSYGGGSHGGASHEHQKRSPLHLDYAWKKMDYVFPNDGLRREAVRTGTYNFTKIIPLDMDVWEKAGRRKVFITMPTDTGVPAALATVSAEGNLHAPLLSPYPDWTWHRRGDCRSISSVYRVAIDDYDRLWVLDRGDSQQCPPKLMTFDLNTDRLLSKYEFSSNLLVNNSNLITPILDVRDHGRNTFVYIADVIGGIIVYDHQSKSAWRVNHPLLLPEEQWATLNIAGSSFYLADGVFGMALSPLRCHEGHGHGQHCNSDRILYFHALASRRENHVNTSVLRNRDNFPRGQNRIPNAFQSFDQRRPSQSAAQAMSQQGVLFSGLLPDLAVTCWNTEQPFAGWNLETVARDPETLQFTSGMKVRYGRLYVMSCRYQKFITGTMNWNEVNYRVQSGNVADLIRGTRCDPKTNNIG